jgi:predicted ATPase
VCVLDHFEHLPPTVTTALASWLETAPECLFVVTSRESVRLPVASRLEVGPLPMADSVAELPASDAALLWERCVRRIRAEYRLTDDDLEAVREVLAALDGIPLAIELAAARSSMMTTRELRERMSNRFALLGGTARHGSARGETLEEAIDASWQLLSDAERSALAQISVLVGEFSLAAAEAVVCLDDLPNAPAPLDVLQTLREKSLLGATTTPDSGQRFHLFASIRDFAAARADRYDACATAPARLADHYAARTPGWLAAAERGDPDTLRALELEQDNLYRVVELLAHSEPAVAHRERRALSLLAAGALIETHGAPARHGPLLDAVITAMSTRPGDPALTGRLYLERAAFRRQRGSLDDAQTDTEHADEIATHHSLDEIHGRAIRRLGMLGVDRGDYHNAHIWLSAAVAHERARGDEVQLGIALSSLGRVEYALGNRAAAEESQREAIGVHERSDNRVWLALTHGYLAYLLIDRGAWDEARGALERAIAIVGDLGSAVYTAAFRGTLGALSHAAGDLEPALVLYGRARDAMARVGRERLAAIHEGNLGTVHHERGDLAIAESFLDQAVWSLRRTGDSSSEVFFALHHACVLADRDRMDDAQRRVDSVQEAMRNDGVVTAVSKGLTEIARAHIALAHARAAARDGNAHERARWLERAAIAETPERDTPADLRIARRRFILRRALDNESGQLVQRSVHLRVAQDTAEFEIDGEGVVSLATRPVMRRLLGALLAARRADLGSVVSPTELIAATWPGERMSESSAVGRLHATVARLRREGLAPVLEHIDGGYRLHPDCVVET